MKIKVLIFVFWLITLGVQGESNQEQSEMIQSSYVKVDDGQLFFQKFGSGDPIIVLHGGPGMDQGYLLPQMLELAKDHEVIFYDQRGSGKSLDTEISPQYINLERFTKDLEQFRLGLELKKFVLIGHSWGSKLAMNYATKYQDAVSALILLNPTSADDNGTQIFYKEMIKRIDRKKNLLQPLFNFEDFEKLDDHEIDDLYKVLFSVYFYDQKNVEYLTLKTNKISARSGFKCRDILNRESINLFPALKLLKIPTLIVHGNQDIMPKLAIHEIKEAIPNTQIVYLEQCGHFPYIEKPKELFSAIRQFLAFLNSSWIKTNSLTSTTPKRCHL